MRRLILRRSLFLVPQMVVISFATFTFMRLLPGNPAVLLAGPTASHEVIKHFEHQLGIDKPFLVQYRNFVWRALHGDLGQSTVTGGSVTRDLLNRTPATLELITLSLLVIVCVAVPLGAYVGRSPTSRLGWLTRKMLFGYGLLAGSIPDFLLGLLLIFVFFYRLRLFPAPVGRLDGSIARPRTITGFLVIDSLLGGDWAAFRSAVLHLILPVSTLVFVYAPVVIKMTSASILPVLNARHIRFARACGLPTRKVMIRALRNAGGPVITMISVTYGYLLGGAVLVETVFSWGGVGQYAVDAVSNADFQAIQGFVLVAVVFSLCVYLIADLIQATLDPRIRL